MLESFLGKNVHNLSCPDCGGSTSLSFYSENRRPHTHCHKCEKQTYSKEFLEEIIKMTATETSNVAQIPSVQKRDKPLQRGIVSGIEERKITLETAEKYGVEKLHTASGGYYGYMFPLYDKDGEFVAQKIKHTSTKKMALLGDPSKAQLFGMKAFSAGGKYITIVEGEEDALATHQMLKKISKGFIDPPVVSLNYGAGNSAIRECQKYWEYINSFENIIICFDGDSLGKETAEKVAKLFPFKAKIMRFPEAKKDATTGTWSLKDASDYCREGKEKEFTQLWWASEKFVPKGIRTFRSLWSDMSKEDTNVCVPFPWEGVNKFTGGLITGKMDVYKAFPKIGKTSLFVEIMSHIRKNSPYNVGGFLLENTTKEIGLKFCGIEMNQPIDRPNYEIDWSLAKEIHDEISKDDRMIFFDPEDERTPENIINKMLYFIKAHNCKFIFLDHASMLAYTSDEGDERKFLDKLFAELKQMTVTFDIYLGVVIHVNDDGKTRGSRAPVQLCDRLYSLQRDKLNPDSIKANTTEFIVEENRYGSSGLAACLFYDQETGRMTELDLDLLMEKQQELNTRELTFDD